MTFLGNLLADTSALTVTGVVLLITLIYFKFKPTQYPGIPGPTPKFLIGNSHTIVKERGLWKALFTWQQKFGKTFQFHLGTKHFVVTTDLDVVEAIYKNRKLERGGAIIEAFKPIANGMLVLVGKIKSLTPLITKEVKTLLDMWETHILPKNQPYECQEDITLTTVDVIGKIGFGTHFNSLNHKYGDGNYVEAPLLESIKVMLATAMANVLPFSWRWWNVHQPRFVKSKKLIHDFVLGICEEYKQNLGKAVDEGTSIEDDEHLMKERNIVVQLLKQPADSFTHDELVDELLTFLTAGQETTATTANWAFKHLTQHPEVQQKLHDEIIKTLGKDGIPTYDAVSAQSMPYLDAVHHEVLRLAKTVTITGRQALEDVTLTIPSLNNTTYHFAKGTRFIMHLHAVHLDPDVWPEPETFNPDRWLPIISGEKKIHPHAWMPFGGGHRVCFGQRLAELELKIILCMLFQRFKLAGIPDELMNWEGVEAVTTYPKNTYIKLEKWQD
ncbi:Cytochrome P450 4d2 [Gaertneriomyces sp. JEL0708]|nr:Cytochrome P450 4d2 [Gaertneriomyces sp. JEL0708]